MNKACVFCEGLKKGVKFESLIVFEDELSMVFLNKYPYNGGHLLVLPKRHEGDLLKLSEEEYIGLHKTLRRAVDAVQTEFRPRAMNVGANLGQAAGAGIPDHLHYHVVPRWDGDTNFFPIIAQSKVIPLSLEEVHQRLLPYFK